MRFPDLNLRYPVIASILAYVLGMIFCVNSYSVNGTIFQYQDMNQCKRNEFYDLDYFACVACNADDENLQPTENKFACQCVANTVTLYDSNRELPICAAQINDCAQNMDDTTTTAPNENCSGNDMENGNSCPIKYVNRTNDDELEHSGKQPTIQIRRLKSNDSINCHCELKYNFHYQDYCIANELLKPYLHYNSFWQPVRGGLIGHFGKLKFVAFFCLRLRNATACNQLANLCITSHFSSDKNSPCSAFLFTQASDVAFRFGANIDEQLRPMQPFLYFKKGQQTAELLRQPVLNSSGYSLDQKSQLQLFSTHYALDGTLKRRGAFFLDYVNLCGMHTLNISIRKILFGAYFRPIRCALSLENLIDLATLGSSSDFLSLFLNYTSTYSTKKVLMHAIPVLVENIIPENQRNQPKEWLLVKRFQMINAQTRFHFGPQKPNYEDSHKLQRYRAIRFVTKFELHYEIHAQNRISVPIVRLSYQDIEFHANATLDEVFTFSMDVTFAKSEASETSTRHELLNETVLPMSLLIVITISLLRAHNYRKRRRSTILTSTTDTPQPVPMELCDFHAVLEFLVQLCSNLSHALLICFLLHVIYDATRFLTQKEVTLTLPLIKDDSTTLELLIYAALLLKFIFYCVHLWRCTHYDLFFIDWERPKSYDNNHFNLKSNLETSSVCSSVRTFISESNVSAWRILFTANEWIRLGTKRKTSAIVQCLVLLVVNKYFKFFETTQHDIVLQLYYIIIAYIVIYLTQQSIQFVFVNYITGDPLKKFIDLCSWANVSVFVLLEPSYGYYIHGRSPHGFADTDMSSMIMQLQRESQSMCGRRGLLTDSDQQTYVILPPINLRTYFQRLLIPFQRSYSISQTHYQKETSNLGVIGGVDGNLERTFIAYSSINRFFCAFIDHAIKDMDYIIKEKTFLERLLDCEFENYLTENKGTFYIDNAYSFSQLFLYGNELHTFVMEFLLLLALFMLSQNLILTLVIICLFNAFIQRIVSLFMRRNVSQKTLIDKRFLL